QAHDTLSHRIVRLLEEHDAYTTEGKSVSGLSLAIKRISCRDNFLHSFCSLLRRGTNRQGDFLSCLDSASSMVKNRALRQLLGDMRNEIVSLTVRVERTWAAHTSVLEWLGTYSDAREQVRLLVEKYGFALWPALDADLQPPVPGLKSDYENAVTI